MNKKYILVISLFLLCFHKSSIASESLVPLKDNINKTEYPSVLCIRLLGVNKNKNLNTNSALTKNPNYTFALKFFDGTKMTVVFLNFKSHYNKEEKALDFNDVFYFAAKPGKYDFYDLLYSFRYGNITEGYSFHINKVLEISAGKAYFAGDMIINIDENHQDTGNIFNNNTINESIVNDFQKNYPGIYDAFKDNFIPAAYTEPKPVLLNKVIFSSRFTKNEGIWNESNDSLHSALFENGQFCLESYSDVNMGNKIIELPEKLGNTFEIELHCKWKSGVTNSSFGFIIPSTKPKADDVKLTPHGYIFGITANGYAGIFFEDFSSNRNHKLLKTFTLTELKKLSVIKTNDSGENVILVQVIDYAISFYVNNVLVVREPYNPRYYGGNTTNFAFFTSDLLGISSFGKQKIEFDELKVSKFK